MNNMFKTVQHQKDVSLSEKVANQIRDLIIERNIGIGDKLPNEFELAESLNVGRGTIREAVKLLVARNCLEIRRGKGTFVTEDVGKVDDPLGFEFVSDKIRLTEDLYEVRMQMEPWIASLAAERILEEEKAELMKRCQDVEDAIVSGVDHYEADNAFHQCIAASTHNLVLSEMIPIINYSVQLFTRFKDPMILQDTIRTHRAIAESICANDTEAARANMQEHIAANLYCIQELKEKTAEAERES